jgi:hypothetical protein
MKRAFGISVVYLASLGLVFGLIQLNLSSVLAKSLIMEVYADYNDTWVDSEVRSAWKEYVLWRYAFIMGTSFVAWLAWYLIMRGRGNPRPQPKVWLESASLLPFVIGLVSLSVVLSYVFFGAALNQNVPVFWDRTIYTFSFWIIPASAFFLSSWCFPPDNVQNPLFRKFLHRGGK